MLKYRYLGVIVGLLILKGGVYAQNKPEITPYTVESTYKKLKKDYPFIVPIWSTESEYIKEWQDLTYHETEQGGLKADVYSPKGKKSSPAILLIHGGGWASGSKENLSVMAQQLAESGFVAVVVNYTLSETAPFPAAVHDLKTALVWMRKNESKFALDQNKIAVLGGSAGGHLATLIGVTSENDKFSRKEYRGLDEVQAIVNIDGITSFTHPEAEEGSGIAAYWLGGTKKENFKNWKLASPLEYVDKDTPPILFINSSQGRFHAGRDDMIAILNKHEIPNKVYTFLDSPHSFWLVQPWYEETLNYTVNFLNNTFN